jgi:integrase
VRVRLRGEQQRTKTFRRLTDAKAWAAKVESDLGHGAYVPTTADRRRTLAELIDKYLDEHLPTKRNNRDRPQQAKQLAWWRDNLGYLTLDKVRPETIAGGRRRLAQRTTRDGTPISGATVNRYLAALSAVCKWAWKELHWLPSNPVLDVSKAPESEGRVRFLSDDERHALLAACRASTDPNIATAVTLALATGARYSNIRYLTWADVDLERGTVQFMTKNGDFRRLPLIEPAQDALEAQLERDPTGEGWAFKGARDDAPADLDKAWRKVRDAAGLEGFRFHDLRHTVASYLTMHGASLAEVAEALGHRTLVMAKRYTHQTGEHVRSTLERMAPHLAPTGSGTGRRKRRPA